MHTLSIYFKPEIDLQPFIKWKYIVKLQADNILVLQTLYKLSKYIFPLTLTFSLRSDRFPSFLYIANSGLCSTASERVIQL